MNNVPTLKKYDRPIRRGRGSNQRDKGRLTAQLVGTRLLIGWSLCNDTARSGDKYDPKIAQSLATGRMMEAGLNNSVAVVGSPSVAPTVAYLQAAGVPQSVIPAVTDLIRNVTANNEVTEIRLYAPKQVKNTVSAW